jgi:hypothetical protein
MHRRSFVIAGALTALSVPANAQSRDKVPIVRVLLIPELSRRFCQLSAEAQH